MDAIITLLCTFLLFHIANGEHIQSTIEHIQSTIVFSPSELINEKLSNSSHSAKSALRYGFHRTSECDNYEKAFLCIQKCVDKGYDVAFSDKYCFCTCYVKKQKANYVPKYLSFRTKWRLGTPRTTKPAWIKKLEDSMPQTTSESATIYKKLVLETTDNDTIIGFSENNETKTESKLEINIPNTTDSLISSDDNNETHTITQISLTNATNNAKEEDVNIKDATAGVKESDGTSTTDTKTVNVVDSVTGSNSSNAEDTNTGSVTKNATNSTKENNVANVDKNENGTENITNAKVNKIDSGTTDAADSEKLSGGSNTTESKTNNGTKNSTDGVKAPSSELNSTTKT